MDQLSAMRCSREWWRRQLLQGGPLSQDAEDHSHHCGSGSEAHLATKLLNRTTRKCGGDDRWRALLRTRCAYLSELDELDGSLSSSQAQPSGKVRVALSGAFADRIIMPALCDFHTRYPKIQLEFDIGDRIVDYVAENIDCALRAGTPTDQSLVAGKWQTWNCGPMPRRSISSGWGSPATRAISKTGTSASAT